MSSKNKKKYINSKFFMSKHQPSIIKLGTHITPIPLIIVTIFKFTTQ